MKKIITLATAGVFLLSLQGASLAQKEEKTPAPPPMIEKQIPTTPKTEAPPAPKMETPAATKGSEVKSTETKAKTKAKKKGKKKKKGRKTKKEKAPVE